MVETGLRLTPNHELGVSFVALKKSLMPRTMSIIFQKILNIDFMYMAKITNIKNNEFGKNILVPHIFILFYTFLFLSLYISYIVSSGLLFTIFLWLCTEIGIN